VKSEASFGGRGVSGGASTLGPRPSALPFVPPHSVVRRIWGDADAILLVFAGSAAEFALNRAVDWLFFTGALPADPVGRVFSTARFAQNIVFVDEATALATLRRIYAVHRDVERARGMRIPDWAHRDVLYMLIDYSARAFELLHRPLAESEWADLYTTFYRVGDALGIPDLPSSVALWRADRVRHLERDLAYSTNTAELYTRFRAQLGPARYALLLQLQRLLVPAHVRRLLRLRAPTWIRPAAAAYRGARREALRHVVRRALVPRRHYAAAAALDRG
jgi:ER-bound oxygenase mpaB/B'/Rubber oxygenase, catalytic domain